jgi:hypothetical protein
MLMNLVSYEITLQMVETGWLGGMLDEVMSRQPPLCVVARVGDGRPNDDASPLKSEIVVRWCSAW